MTKEEAEKKLVEYSQRFHSVFNNRSTPENTEKANALYNELIKALCAEPAAPKAADHSADAGKMGEKDHSGDTNKMIDGVSFDLAAVVTEDNKLISETLCPWDKRDLLTVDPFLKDGVNHQIVKLHAVEVKP